MGVAYSQWPQIVFEYHSLDSRPQAYQQFHRPESVRENLGVGLGSEAFSGYLESTVRANVDLNIDPLSIIAHKLIGMARVTMHVVVTVWSATIREKDQNLVNTLRVLRKIVLKKRQVSHRQSIRAFDRLQSVTGTIVKLTQNMSASFRCV